MKKNHVTGIRTVRWETYLFPAIHFKHGYVPITVNFVPWGVAEGRLALKSVHCSLGGEKPQCELVDVQCLALPGDLLRIRRKVPSSDAVSAGGHSKRA